MYSGWGCKENTEIILHGMWMCLWAQYVRYTRRALKSIYTKGAMGAGRRRKSVCVKGLSCARVLLVGLAWHSIECESVLDGLFQQQTFVHHFISTWHCFCGCRRRALSNFKLSCTVLWVTFCECVRMRVKWSENTNSTKTFVFIFIFMFLSYPHTLPHCLNFATLKEPKLGT